MPFTDEHAFLEAIFSRHHDDGLRFIYADFLDDAGDPDRAELVRVQVALARTTEDHPRRAELVNRENDLLTAHHERWTEHLSDLVRYAEFRRGVLDSVLMDAPAFLERGEELFRRVTLRRVCLRGVAEVLPALIKFPLLGAIRELEVWGNNLGNGGVNLLVLSPHLQSLETLDLGYDDIDDAGVRTLARATTLPKLTSLSLSLNERITSAGAAEIAASPFLAGLTTLDLSSNAIDEAGLEAIASSKMLQDLHTLRISENRIGDAGVASLVNSTLLGRMLARSTRLELRDNRIGPTGAATLAACPLMSRCLALDLSRNAIEDAGLASLVGSPNLTGLRVLKVGRNQISDGGIAHLRPHWPRMFAQLRTLDLSENRLTNYGVNEIRRFNPNGVVMLDVSRNVQAVAGGDSPGSKGDAARNRADEVAAAAELRRRVSHPALRRSDGRQ